MVPTKRRIQAWSMYCLGYDCLCWESLSGHCTLKNRCFAMQATNVCPDHERTVSVLSANLGADMCLNSHS